MKKATYAILVVVLMAMIAGACKKGTTAEQATLLQLAKNLNEMPDTTLSNGDVLTGCKYDLGDSTFTYIIKVNDNRYNNVSIDSLKTEMSKDFQTASNKKLIKLLNKASVGLEYCYQTPSDTITITFPSEDLKKIKFAPAEAK